jgi:hypothetical protein
MEQHAQSAALVQTLLHDTTHAPEVRWQALLRQKLVEVSGSKGAARFSLAVAMVLGAQRACETVAWIQPEGGPLYPPDLHASGVDLDALVVVHVPPRQKTRHAALKSAEILLRSGGYGLVVVDLTAGAPPGNVAWQGRLLALARQHQSCVVLLTEKTTQVDSLGALVSVRLEPRRVGQGLHAFQLQPHILKNKMGLDLPPWRLLRRGPTGLW